METREDPPGQRVRTSRPPHHALGTWLPQVSDSLLEVGGKVRNSKRLSIYPKETK